MIGEANNYYQPGWPLNQPNDDVCPGCGRCNQCGRYGTTPYQPTWTYKPTVTTGTGAGDFNFDFISTGSSAITIKAQTS